jgi:hypothetical protein
VWNVTQNLRQLSSTEFAGSARAVR